MEIRIVSTGDSPSIGPAESLVTWSGLADEAQAGRIVIRAAGQPRQGWEEAFRSMAERGDDVLLAADPTGPAAWDELEWQW